MIQPVSVPQLVSSTIVPGRYRRAAGTVTSVGATRKVPACRPSTAPKTLGESIRGRHIQSTLPPGATRAVTSPSERNPYSPIGTVRWPGPAAPGTTPPVVSISWSPSAQDGLVRGGAQVPAQNVRSLLQAQDGPPPAPLEGCTHEETGPRDYAVGPEMVRRRPHDERGDRRVQRSEPPP